MSADVESRATEEPVEESRASSPSSSSDGSDSDSDSGQPIEWLVTARGKRSTAGNRMKTMLANEEPDSDMELLFAEDEDDEGFTDEDEAASDVHMDSSSDDEDDKNGATDDLEGEKELERQAQERRAAQRKRKAQEAIPAKFRKRVRIDTSATPPAPRPKKKSERASWLPTAADMPTRASSRQTTRLSKEQLHAQMEEREARRLKQLEHMQRKAARMEALKKPPMTQEDRLREAEMVEQRNSKSLNRWEEAEKQREEERLAKLAALNERTLKGPVITFWSGTRLWKDGGAAKYVVMEEKPKRKERKPKEKEKGKGAVKVEEGENAKDATPSGDAAKGESQKEKTATADGQPAASETNGAGESTPQTTDEAKTSAPKESAQEPGEKPTEESTQTGGDQPAEPAQAEAEKATTTQESTPAAGEKPETELKEPAAPEEPTQEPDKPASPPAPDPEAKPKEPTPPKDKQTSPPSEPAAPDSKMTDSAAASSPEATAPPVTEPPSGTDVDYTSPPAAAQEEDVPMTDAPVSAEKSDKAPKTSEPEPSEQNSKPAEPLPQNNEAPQEKNDTPKENTDASANAPEENKDTPQKPAEETTKPTPADTTTNAPLVQRDSTAPADETTPADAAQEPVSEGIISTRRAIIYQNFNEDAIRDKSVQTQILFGRKMNKLPKPSPAPMCVITNLPALYRDPRTGLPFRTAAAYREIQRLYDSEYHFSKTLGAWVGSGTSAAKGVPARFLNPDAPGPVRPPKETAKENPKEDAGKGEAPKTDAEKAETSKSESAEGEPAKTGEMALDEKEEGKEQAKTEVATT